VTDPDGGEAFFRGVGSSRALLRDKDWSATSLGPVEQWTAELRSAVRTVLASKVPMLLWWGSELIQVHNDAFAALLGERHPAALGRPAPDYWAEAWEDMGALAAGVFADGEAVFAEDRLFFLTRNDYVEETYWTLSYSAIEDDQGAVGGVLVVATEVTARVVDTRRLRTIHELGLVSIAEQGTPADACRAAVAVIARNRAAVPCASVWLREAGDGKRARLVASYGIDPDPAKTHFQHMRVDDSTAAGRVMMTGHAEFLSNLERWWPQYEFVAGPLGPARPKASMVVPLTVSGQPRPVGALALGLNPYRSVDDSYRTYFDLVERQFSLLLTDVSAAEADRRRAAELAELDREKTSFFQNVSHEFRTPLTLLLGTLGELLMGRHDLADEDRDALAAARRAALQLERLVDALLDFARAEGGTLEPDREPTDLASLTGELVGMFRAAVEEADLTLAVDISDAAVSVNIDREMWARIVLNLLSNAIKYTESGMISIRLLAADDKVQLAVADTGRGIPLAEQHRIFDRFHRVGSGRGEGPHGAGIGLALVAQLVHAHGGTVTVDSAPGRGSTFTVLIPRGGAPDAPPRPLGLPSEAATAVVSGMIPRATSPTRTTTLGMGSEDAPRLLLVEDNADLRAYLTRLLAEDGWTVDATADVESALSLPEVPDLILSDLMLPGRDGLELVRLVRSVPDRARTPIILLTARAGPESAAEGMQSGADDYITKPFDPRELLARVRVHYELSQLREYALSEAQNKAANLQKALASNRTIGAALGILMAEHKITHDDAFELLRRSSQHNHRKLHDIAEEVTLTGTLPDDPTASGD
jgi:signal transduction histidine kinase/DNA-binding response OmpR family regulator